MLARLGLMALDMKFHDLMQEHYSRAVKIRVHFDSRQFVTNDAPGYIPPCHCVARAYAEVFKVEYVDGWRNTIAFDKSEPQPWYRYGHSWNVITFDANVRVVFDLFPEETCSMFPVMLMHRDAVFSYVRGEDHEIIQIEEKMREYRMQEVITRLKQEFLRIDAL